MIAVMNILTFSEYDMSKGFCVSGAETEQFLRDKLRFIGLNEKELEDFIEFWVPYMEKNAFNKICFQTTAYTENAKLTVSPEPDSILRLFMVFQPLDKFVEIEEQPLAQFQRTGFTLVEWGGDSRSGSPGSPGRKPGSGGTYSPAGDG